MFKSSIFTKFKLVGSFDYFLRKGTSSSSSVSESFAKYFFFSFFLLLAISCIRSFNSSSFFIKFLHLSFKSDLTRPLNSPDSNMSFQLPTPYLKTPAISLSSSSLVHLFLDLPARDVVPFRAVKSRRVIGA